jgi:iron complex outermembrane receptor protein
MKIFGFRSLCLLFLLCSVTPAFAQSGTITGAVTIKGREGLGLHNASVRILQLGRVTDTAGDGTYVFADVPPGIYDVSASMPSMEGSSKLATVVAGQTTTLDFALEIAALRSEVTVTASGREELTLRSFQTVTSLDALELARTPAASLGEALENRPGVASRDLGPGSSRPVIRGFDGDRVLVLLDGSPAGALGSQSGDHPEPVNTSAVERVEVLRGPATLLYGPNAIGGVVNAVSAETNLHEHAHEGMQGFATGLGSSNNNAAGGSLSFDYGYRGWRLFGNGGAQTAGSYSSPDGEVANTHTRMANGQLGFGLNRSDRLFFSASGGYDTGVNGILGEDANIDFRRYNGRFNGGVRYAGSAIETIRAQLSYTDWSHSEIEEGQVATTLSNRQLNYRGVFEQRQDASWSGSFGISGMFRDFESAGDEVLTPATTQKNVAVFALQEIGRDELRFQLGGRLDHVRYAPDARQALQFSGLSGGAGVHFALWEQGAFVANFTTSWRAPALEELYNNGPHPGNLAFEIGDEGLQRERSNGIDLSLRHHGARVRAEANLFRYGISDFVFLSPTGAVEEDLNVFVYTQDDATFTGAEATLNLALQEYLWLNLGFDTVRAKMSATGQSLPRIPPLRGNGGLELRWRGLTVRPEIQAARSQENLAAFESRTAGYTVFHLRGSYSIVQQHAVHMLALNFFNMGNRLYRNHVSFLKEEGPEIGRGVNVSYSIRFF